MENLLGNRILGEKRHSYVLSIDSNLPYGSSVSNNTGYHMNSTRYDRDEDDDTWGAEVPALHEDPEDPDAPSDESDGETVVYNGEEE